jgi:hypothetical protein
MQLREAATKCCEYGLNLVSLDAVNELSCLVSANFGMKSFIKLVNQTNGCTLGNLARPLKIWTSGTRRGAGGDKYRWCASNSPLVYANFNWSTYHFLDDLHDSASIYLQSTITESYFNMELAANDCCRCHALCE